MSHPWPIDRNRRREIDEGNQTPSEMDRDEVTFPFQFGDKIFVTVFLLSLACKAKLTHTPRPAVRANLSKKRIFCLRLLSSVYGFSTVVTSPGVGVVAAPSRCRSCLGIDCRTEAARLRIIHAWMTSPPHVVLPGAALCLA